MKRLFRIYGHAYGREGAPSVGDAVDVSAPDLGSVITRFRGAGGIEYGNGRCYMPWPPAKIEEIEIREDATE